MDKNHLSPVCSSEEQPWYKFTGPIFQQQAQIQDLDGEKSSYIDLDACKRNNSDASPLVDTLNIRTDEKMPAKGEISEQESNGDVDLSWSQMFYNDTPRINNQQDNFGNRESGSFGNEGFFFYHQNLNSIPKAITDSTISNIVEKNQANVTHQTKGVKRNKTMRKKKCFQCDHCFLTFAKLKDRNVHLINEHNYKRINRRLIRDIIPVAITDATLEGPQQTDEMILPGPPDIEDSKPTKISQTSTITATTTTGTSVTTITSSNMSRLYSLRTGVYRMLMNYNLSVLKQKTLVEPDNSLFDSKTFFCYTCREDFLNVKTFDEHLNEHPAECFTCGKKFTRWTYFSVHLKRHLGWKDFACTVCSKKFVVRSALIEHMRMHTGSNPLKCKLCDKHFRRYSNLTQHRKVCHSTRSIKKEYVCSCGEVLPSKARYFWHREIHDTKPKCCPHCPDRFVHSNSLRRHIRLAHSDKFNYSEPVECPICNQMYAKTSLKTHMTTHNVDQQYECVICNKTFSTKWNLKIHSWVHANRTAKPFKCELCVKAFIREVDYKNHMNSHKQIKPYTCEYCGCKFIRKYNYMRHRREHHGQKKFSCDLCGKLFHRHYYLIEHRRIHTGERPFLCTICGKSSTTKTNHNKHLKIHHSRDPFTTET